MDGVSTRGFLFAGGAGLALLLGGAAATGGGAIDDDDMVSKDENRPNKFNLFKSSAQSRSRACIGVPVSF